MMNSDPNQIDRIVREVIRRLEQVPARGTPPPKVAAIDVLDSSTLRVGDRVVTGALLDGRLDGICRVEVRDDAVVTPLVKDLLKQKRVELQRTTQRHDAAGHRWLLVEPGRCHQESVLAKLTTIDALWGPIADWQQLVDSMTERDAAIVVTPAWAARVCQANRRETVRAVHVTDLATVRQALDQVNANLLVVDAERCDEAAVAEIAREFVGAEV